jgi:hypothetical protein
MRSAGAPGTGTSIWAGVGSDGPASTFGEPPLAETPPFVLGVSAPHPSFLVGLEGVLEALILNRTLGANGFGGGNVVEGRPRGTHGKKQRRL